MNRRFHTWFAALLVLAALAPAGRAALPRDPDPDSGAELIGSAARSFKFDRWIRTKPMTISTLRGKVVLLRWWTEECHFCETTLPAIEALRREHSGDDLVVIGVFHPKPPHAVKDRDVVAKAEALGFHGPLAVDTRWRTLDRYWLDGHPDRNWTSVSFLIDRQGLIRWVHGGGEYHPSDDPKHAQCDLEFRELKKELDVVLAE